MSALGAALDSDEESARCGQQRKVELLDDDDRAQIVAAYRAKRSAEWIAVKLTEAGFDISQSGIRNYLIRIGEWRGRDR